MLFGGILTHPNGQPKVSGHHKSNLDIRIDRFSHKNNKNWSTEDEIMVVYQTEEYRSGIPWGFSLFSPQKFMPGSFWSSLYPSTHMKA